MTLPFCSPSASRLSVAGDEHVDAAVRRDETADAGDAVDADREAAHAVGDEKRQQARTFGTNVDCCSGWLRSIETRAMAPIAASFVRSEPCGSRSEGQSATRSWSSSMRVPTAMGLSATTTFTVWPLRSGARPIDLALLLFQIPIDERREQRAEHDRQQEDHSRSLHPAP
jgi:hypothetical protein